MKKAIMLFFILIMFVVIVSAAEWDNIKDYDEESKTITISNSFLRLFELGEVAKITLISDQDNKVIDRGVGKYQLVSELKIENYGDDYPFPFDLMEFYDIKNNMNEFNRDFQFKYKIKTGVREIPSYREECVLDVKNGTKCELVLDHVGYKDIYDWKDLEIEKLEALPMGNITLGIFTDVQSGENVEYVPTWFNVRMDEFASWNDTFNVGLTYVWQFNGTAESVEGLHNLTANEGTPSVRAGNQCINDGCYNYSTGNNHDIDDDGIDVFDFRTFNITWNVWINSENLADSTILAKKFDTEGYDAGYHGLNDLRYIRVGSDAVMTAPFPANNGTWWMLTLTVNDTGTGFYINGTDWGHSGVGTTYSGGNYALKVGTGKTDSSDYTGMIDEFYIWNRTLTQGEITSLYDGGTGTFYEPSAIIPTFNITYPLNLTYNVAVTQLNYTAINGELCWYSVNGGTTNASTVACGTNFSVTAEGGSNTWSIYGNSSDGTLGSWTTTFSINNSVTSISSKPDVSFNTSLTSIDFQVNGTAAGALTLTNVTLFIYNSTNHIIFENNSVMTGTSNNSQWTVTFNKDDTYRWNGQVFGSDATWDFDSNRTIIIDTAPPVVDVFFPNGTLAFSQLGGSLYVNWSASDVGLGLQACWMEYNNVNTSLTCSDNNATFTTTTAMNLTFWANDTSGNIARDNTNWSYEIFVTEESYDVFLYETENSTFNITMDLAAGTTLYSANLVYNRTSYLGNVSSLGGTLYLAERQIDVPNVSSRANVTFRWAFTYTSVGGYVSQNATVHSLEVLPTNITNISVDGGWLALNYSIYYEEDLSPYTAGLDTTFSRYLGLGSERKTQAYDSPSPATFFDFYIDPRNRTFYTDHTVLLMDSNVTVETDDILRKFDFFRDVLVNGTTVVRELLVPNASMTSDVIIEISDVGLAPRDDIYVSVYRYYPEIDRYKLVESRRTNAFGQVRTRLVEKDVQYRIELTDTTGTLLRTILEPSILCTGTYCILKYNTPSEDDIFERFEDIEGYNAVTYNNNTRAFTFSWATATDGITNFTRVLEVTRYNINGSYLVCRNTSESDNFALVCGVPTDQASYHAQAFLITDGNEARLSTISAKVGSIAASVFSQEGLFWAIILFMILVGVGIWSPVVAVVLGIIGMVFLSINDIIYLNPAMFVAMIIIGGVIIWALRE